MFWKKAGSTKAGFAVGHHEICEFFARVEFDDQPGQACLPFFLAGSRSLFDQADEIVAPGGNLGEPEMSGRVGSGCAEIENQPLFHLKPVSASCRQSV